MRPFGLARQFHVRLLGRLVALFQVASTTACDEVIPSMGPTRPPRDYVIDRELLALDSAVLTDVVVARQDAMSREPQFGHWPSNCVAHLENRRRLGVAANRPQRGISVMDDLRLPKQHKSHGAPKRAHIKWLIVRV